MRQRLLCALPLVALSLNIPAAAQDVASLALNPSTVPGGSSTTVTVTLTASAPIGGVLVRFTSPNPALIVSPDSVLVPGGVRTTSFNVTPFPVDNTLSTSLNAGTSGGPSQSASLTVASGPTWRTRIAVFRPSASLWLIRRDGGATTPVQFGQPGDMPAPADYLGYGKDANAIGYTQIAVFRPLSGTWFLSSETGTVGVPFGQPGDLPAPADYFGFGRAQAAVFRPDTRQWYIRHDNGGATIIDFGEFEDTPLPGDYLATGRAQLAIYRPSTQEWFIRKDNGEFIKIKFGEENDQPVPGDYFGLGRLQIAVFRPSTREWIIRHDDGNFSRISFDVPGTLGVPADYLGLGRTQMATYLPATGEWFIRTDGGSALRVQYGGLGDRPVPSPYSSRVTP